MPFETLARDAPAGLVTDRFTLRPIVADDAPSDYEAVMESRSYLRDWEGSGWPADDFTLEANREDLVELQRRHEAGYAFTYTVLDPAGTTVGCVYVMPPDARMFLKARISPLGDDRWEDHGAGVFFWVRRSVLATGAHGALLDALRAWLAEEWPLDDPLFVTNERYAAQVELLEAAGLRRRFVIDVPDREGPYLAYG
ncbi:MAG TPA: hypothetical protein VIL36_16775 [Acidimicrobiales bacterium]